MRSRLCGGAALALGCSPALAWGADAPKPPPPDNPKTVSEVVVRPEAGGKGAAVGDIKPDLQLQPEDVQAYGVSTITELLAQLAPEIGSNSGRGGEGPAILVNGKRISGINEIRNIPTEAILRVDILPEEAALKYGFTANQRVVNIVLKDHVGADLVAAQGGSATEGGGAAGQFEAGRTRINGERRFNIDLKYNPQASLTEAERNLTSLATGSPTIDVVDQRPFRTLVPQSDKVALNAVYTRPIWAGVQATVNGTLEWTGTQATRGLPAISLTAPGPTEVGRIVTALGPLRQDTQAWTGHGGASLNRDVSGWRMALTGNYDHADSRNENDVGVSAGALQAAVNAGTVNPFGPLPANLLSRLARDTSDAISDSGNLQFIASGPLITLPAGAIRGSFRVGATAARFQSESTRSALDQSETFSQSQANAQANIDVPLTSRDKKILGALGDFNLNGHLQIQHVSGFGELTDWGYGVHWTPVKGLSILVGWQRDEAAPSQPQLQAPVLLTPGSRIFDFATGQTVDVIRVSGGNPALVADARDRTSVRITWQPWQDRQFIARADFNAIRYRNPLTTFPAASAAIEAAFPDRFTRDANGVLTEVDYRPVNFASQDVTSLKWGFDWSRPIGPVRAPPPRSQVVQELRRAGLAGQVGRRAGGPPPGVVAGAQPAPDGTPGARGPGADGAPQPAADGAAPRAGGRGPGGGGFAGRGAGGFGGGGGRAGGRGGRGAQDGRLHISLFHTVYFDDRFLVRPGGPVIDFLNGASLSGAGGRPQHEVQAQINIAERGFGGELSVDWTSATSVIGAAPSGGDLNFSDLTKVNARLFADLGQRRTLVSEHPWLKGVRLSLSVSNLFDQRMKVTDATGATPLNFQPAYLDAPGRTWRIEVRKLFASGV